MRTPWLATLGAVFPATFGTRWHPPLAEPPADVADQGVAVPSDAAALRPAPRPPQASAGAHDPVYLRVVPFVPQAGIPAHRRLHPRIVDPFRAFPRRASDLLELMHPADPRD